MRALPRPGRYLRPAAAAAVLLLLAWPVSASWGHASRLVAGTRDQLSATPTAAAERAAPPAGAPAATAEPADGPPAPAPVSDESAGATPAD